MRLKALLNILIVAFSLPAATADLATQAGGRLLVRWRAEATTAAARQAQAQVLEDAGREIQQLLRSGRRVTPTLQVYEMDQQVSAAELNRVMARLESDPQVLWVAPDRRVRAHAYTPDDPRYAGQWYLQDQQLAGIRANRAWDLSRGGIPGAGVVVAVLDTGVRFDHPDLAAAAAGGKLLPGYDFVSSDRAGVFATANDGNGWDADASDPGDFLSAADLDSDIFRNKKCGGGDDEDQPTLSSWHGTRVAGMVGAATDNGVGISGAGFQARVLPVRVLGKCGGFDSDVLAGMYWAAGLSIPTALLEGTPPANPTPARIINMSLGGEGACSAAYAEAVREITAAGVLVVASAGNDGTSVDSPANCTGAMAVAGVRHIGTKVGFSNLGAEVAISAPGGNCVLIGAGDPCLFSLDTTTDAGSQGPVAAGYTDQFDINVGTSFAAPLVAATAALMRAVNPALAPVQLVQRIKVGAMPFPTTSTTVPAPPQCQSPLVVTEPQVSECLCTTLVCGAGLLDAEAAVRDALRPAALAVFTGLPSPGRSLTLDGSASAASNGRRLVNYAWSVVEVSGGAGQPAFADPGAAITTVLSPSLGSYLLRLTVTDDTGATDTTDITIRAANSGSGGGSTASPPAASGGGGGSTTPLLAWGLALLAVLRWVSHGRLRIKA